tara:strand:+ start:761 stop:1222 length:462 start_codon:yes stop_codon:yes gene_type:complete
MKAIKWNGGDNNGVVIYLFADDTAIDVQSDKTVIGDPETLIISDCNSSNVTVVTGVTDPSDYWGWKYKHTSGSSLSVNSDFKGSKNLDADITSLDTTINVGNSNPFTTAGTVKIGDEKIAYTGVSGTALTGATRGSNSTTAEAHTSGSYITQV